MLDLMSDATFYQVPDHVPPELVYPFEQVFAKGFDVDPWEVFRRVKEEAPPVFFSPVPVASRQILREG